MRISCNKFDGKSNSVFFLTDYIKCSPEWNLPAETSQIRIVSN